MKICSVVGARPQFVKAAVVSRALRSCHDVTEVLIHTGQHYDDSMSSVFFDELEIPTPDHQLGVGSGRHGEQTGRMLAEIERVLVGESPAWVIVYGDTNSTLAGALAAAKLHLPIAHVEAGLRSFNRRMPEEVNRVLTDHVSTLLFAPTETSVANLRREGIDSSRVRAVGDVMYDAALYYADRAKTRLAERLGLDAGRYTLATIHRAENTDDADRMVAIVGALCEFTARLPVLLPLHPRTSAALARHGLLDRAAAAITLIEPIGYLEMIEAESNAALIVTDSGGVQKEAFFYRVPCVTLRDETEWVELVEWGWNRVCRPTSEREVLEALHRALDQPVVERLNPVRPYGGGVAGERIAQALLLA